MKIMIEIPVEIDGPLDSDDYNKLKRYLEQATIPVIKEFAESNFKPAPRMLGTICRFSFSNPKIKIG